MQNLLDPSRPYPEIMRLTEACDTGLGALLDHAGYSAHHAPTIDAHNRQGNVAMFVRGFDRAGGSGKLLASWGKA